MWFVAARSARTMVGEDEIPTPKLVIVRVAEDGLRIPAEEVMSIIWPNLWCGTSFHARRSADTRA
jgi:hypothetical protein